jgi:phage FluMu protein gp41
MKMGDPYLHRECSGTLDLTHARFTQHDPVSVKISGSGYIPADQYSVKLEGVELAGYQTVIVGGIRDPFIIRQFRPLDRRGESGDRRTGR